MLALGFAQGVFKDSFAIGRWISEEGGAFNLGFFGNRRANSIFAHSEDFGFFSAMIASVALAYLVAKRSNLGQKIISAVVFLGALACVYLTYTRAAYMMLAFALFTVSSSASGLVVGMSNGCQRYIYWPQRYSISPLQS